jgi:ubiquinone/menaquinone biosynthesis C-methylase UbiE
MDQKRIAGVTAGIVGAALLGIGLWWRRHPSACPYGLRISLELPHPFLTRSRLREILAPKPGERLLEVGPGTGYHALYVARWLEPGGALDILDVQQEMLDHTMRRARELGISNVVPTRGDARELPYPDETFDAAYLNFVLGEVPAQDSALRELRRVLKPGGRLVVGEAFPDPHMVKVDRLRQKVEAAGLRFERRLGRPFGYYARFIA